MVLDAFPEDFKHHKAENLLQELEGLRLIELSSPCLLYTSDAADERSSVDLGGRRIIKKKNKVVQSSPLNKEYQ